MRTSIKEVDKKKNITLAVLLGTFGVQALFSREEKRISSFLTIQASPLVTNYWERMSSSSYHQNNELISKMTGGEVPSL